MTGNHRFILAFGDSDLTNNAYYDIAVSPTDDPTGNWFVYRFLTPSRGNALNDFIRLGQDRQGVYVASNLFNLNGGVISSYLFEEWLFLPKSPLLCWNAGRQLLASVRDAGKRRLYATRPNPRMSQPFR